MASKVSGFKGLSRNLRTLSQNMQRPVGEASRKALAPILSQSKANLRANGSVVTGALLKGMKIKQKSKKKNRTVTAVGATGEAISEAHLVEFGTEPHFQPKRNQMHPGAEAKPFLEPAYVQHQKKTVQIFGKELGAAMERQAERMSKRD